jgi:hypothetical protein
MNGGKNPVRDGDYRLLEWVDSIKAGSITGCVMIVERQDVSGDDQYVLRLVTKRADGLYVLKAANPDYSDFEANEEMRPLARLQAVWSGNEYARRVRCRRNRTIAESFAYSGDPVNVNTDSDDRDLRFGHDDRRFRKIVRNRSRWVGIRNTKQGGPDRYRRGIRLTADQR